MVALWLGGEGGAARGRREWGTIGLYKKGPRISFWGSSKIAEGEKSFGGDASAQSIGNIRGTPTPAAILFCMLRKEGKVKHSHEGSINNKGSNTRRRKGSCYFLTEKGWWLTRLEVLP